MLTESGWPQSIWNSWWSLLIVGLLFAAGFAWIVLTEDPDPPAPERDDQDRSARS